MGPPSVPHVNEDFFKIYFLGAHVRLMVHLCLFKTSPLSGRGGVGRDRLEN